MIVKKKYQCSCCETVHENTWDAEECCLPDVWEIWECQGCEKTYETNAEAVICCPPSPDSPEAWQAKIDELEHLGQLRLQLLP